MSNRTKNMIAAMCIYSCIFFSLYLWVMGTTETTVGDRFLSAFMYVSFGGLVAIITNDTTKKY